MTNLSDLVYKIIPVLTLTFLGSITASSFILSYVALVKLAREADIPPLLAPLWPLCLDFFMLCASLYVLRRIIADQGQSIRYGWSVIIICTGLSVFFNMYASGGIWYELIPKEIIYQIMYAIPPAFVCISFEMFLSLLRPKKGKMEKEDKDPVPVQTIQDKQVTDPQAPAARIITFIQDKPGSSYAVIAQNLSLSREQVIYHSRKLMSAGLLVRTEAGLQVGKEQGEMV